MDGLIIVEVNKPPENEALEAFEDFIALFGKRNYFGEIKRPQPPWPKGAL